jgi:hypothetical protein
VAVSGKTAKDMAATRADLTKRFNTFIVFSGFIFCTQVARTTEHACHTVGDRHKSVKLVKPYLPVTPRQKAL